MTPNSRYPVTLRDAELSDAEALVDIWQGVIRRAERSEQVADMESVVHEVGQHEDRRVLVAVVEGTVVGAVYLQAATVTPINLEPALLTVSPHVLASHRRHGIGHALVEAAVAWAEELGIAYVATAATAGARDANRFMARLALTPTAMLRVATTVAVRSKLAGHGTSLTRSRARVLSMRRTQRRTRPA